MKGMNFWLRKFVMEVRKKDGEPYPPDSLYSLCCGLFHGLKDADWFGLKAFDNPEFAQSCSTLDVQMKELKSTGKNKRSRHSELRNGRSIVGKGSFG